MTYENKQSWISLLFPISLLSFITWIIYYPSLTYEFQFDDLANITKHFNIRHYNLSQLFFSGTRWISYWINSIYYSIDGFNPLLYRIGNVAIHTCNGILLFYILRTTLSTLTLPFFKVHGSRIAFISALLFLLHPVQTQTVSYVIQGQLEGLAALSILLIIFCLLQYCSTTNLRKIVWYILACTTAMLATGTKEIAIVAPVLLMLVDWFLVAQGDWKLYKERLFFHMSITTIIVGCYLILLKPAFFRTILGLSYEAKNNLGNIITQDPAEPIRPFIYLISEFKVILHYLTIFIWPYNISVEYDWKLVPGFFSADCLIPLFALMTLTYIVVMLLKKDRAHPIAFGALWFALSIAPRSTIVPSPELVADYKTYIASVGLIFILASGIMILISYIQHYCANIITGKSHIIAYGAYCFLTLFLGSATIARNTVWRSGLEFWDNIICNAPGKARAYNNYGVELSQKLQKYTESIPYFQRAIDMDSQYPDPYNNIAVAYSQVGQLDKAIDALKQAIRITPTHVEGYNNIAALFLEKKDMENARRALNNALMLRPHYGKAHFNMGRLYMMENNDEEAWKCFKNACTQADLDTSNTGFEAYGALSIRLGKTQDAITAYEKLVSLYPQNINYHLQLAVAYATNQQHQKAISIYEHINKSVSDERSWYHLAESYIAIKEHTKALNCYTHITITKENAPNIAYKKALCYEQLNDISTSYKILKDTLALDIAPEVKSMFQNIMTQLEQTYNIAHIVT